MTRTTVFQMNSIPKVQIRGGTGRGVNGSLLARVPLWEANKVSHQGGRGKAKLGC